MEPRGAGVVAPEPLAGEVPMAVPPVVAVMVTHDPGDWFEDTLQSLADQTYPDLSVLVIDAASAVDPTARIAARLPTAYVRRLDDNPGYSAAANEVLAEQRDAWVVAAEVIEEVGP
ncbi:MAG TPA: glycosyltransferase family A protein, partial [Acidimicrobiales bacterium]